MEEEKEVKICKYCRKVILSDEEFVKCWESISPAHSKFTGYMHEICADHLQDMVRDDY